jgi:DNA polymerase alpha-associated DNA helicase A
VHRFYFKHRMLETLSMLQEDIKRTQKPLTLGLLGQTKLKSSINQEENIQFFDNSLNEYQKDAVKFALGPSVVSLIHGPPGISD